MKPAFVLLSWLLCVGAWSCYAEESEPLTLETLTGKVYQNAKVSKVMPDGIIFFHEGGVATVPFTELSKEWREKFDYDPEKAERAVAERQAAQAARMQVEAQRREQARTQGATTTQEAKIRIVTAEQMKNYWLNTFPVPRKLASDYHQKKKEYENLVKMIQSGKLDDRAQREALAHNIAEYQRVGELERAASVQADLSILDQRIAAKKAEDARNQTNSELQRLNVAVDMLRHQNMIRDW